MWSRQIGTISILTVQETFDFAAWCQGTGDRKGQYPSLYAVQRCHSAAISHFMSANLSSNLQISTKAVLTLAPTWNVLSGFYVPNSVSLPRQ